MRDENFTIADAIQIQTEDLAKWKTVLNDTAYAELKAECEANNLEGYDDAYKVFRGQDLTSFVTNLSYRRWPGTRGEK